MVCVGIVGILEDTNWFIIKIFKEFTLMIYKFDVGNVPLIHKLNL